MKIFFMAFCMVVLTAAGAKAAEGVAVAELFTSQSCPSCPPADALLERLTKNKNIIALGCHVTYWDRPSRKNELSQSFCTERQRTYQSLLGAWSYTPQLVVNGRKEMNGTYDFLVNRAVNRGIESGETLPLALELKEGKIKTILPDIYTKGQSVVLFLFAFDSRSIQPASGGRTLTYVHPVRAQKGWGPWNGEAKTVEVELPDAKVTGGYALLVQSQDTGAILAAGQALVADGPAP